MKTIKILYSLSLVLLLSGIAAVYAGTSFKLNKGVEDIFSVAKVTYVVHIENSGDLAGFSCNLYIIVSDQNGNPVAPAQVFHPGIWTYTFYGYSNKGPSRVARLTVQARNVCPNNINYMPETLTGHFDFGKIYYFNLTPEPLSPK